MCPNVTLFLSVHEKSSNGAMCKFSYWFISTEVDSVTA